MPLIIAALEALPFSWDSNSLPRLNEEKLRCDTTIRRWLDRIGTPLHMMREIELATNYEFTEPRESQTECTVSAQLQ